MSKIDLKRVRNTNILILLKAAEKLGIDFEILDIEKYKIRFFKNDKKHIISKRSNGLNSRKSINISINKHKTYRALKNNNLPVLKQITIKSIDDYKLKNEEIPFPQVIKPKYGEKGKNIYLNIKNKKEGINACKEFFKEVKSGVVEPYFKGEDYRFLVLKRRVIGIAKRKPPAIIGDGKHNIKELIKKENKRRLEYNKKIGRRMLNRMLVWKRIGWYLNNQGLKFTDILEKDKKITLFPIPNFSIGGTVETIDKEKIHPSFLNLCKEAAEAVCLVLTGIDILAKDIQKKVNKNNCCIIEVNSDPGLRLHDWPNKGRSQRVAEKILKFIFLEKK